MSEKKGFYGFVMTIEANGGQPLGKNLTRIEIKRADSGSLHLVVKSLDKIRLNWGDTITCVSGAVKLHALDTPQDFTTALFSLPHGSERKTMTISETEIEAVKIEYGKQHFQRPGIRASDKVDMSRYAGYTGR
jgi:hypothetical protein